MGWSKYNENNVSRKRQKCLEFFGDKEFMRYLNNLVSGEIVAKSGQEIAKSQIENVIFKLERVSWLTMTDGDAKQAEDLYGFYQEWLTN